MEYLLFDIKNIILNFSAEFVVSVVLVVHALEDTFAHIIQRGEDLVVPVEAINIGTLRATI